MSLLVQMGKPIGILAAVLSIIQGLIWVILTILGLLVYSCAIDTTSPIISDTITEADVFIQTLVNLYFLPADKCTGVDAIPVIPNLLQPEDVQIIVIVNLVFNILWIASSSYYLVELFKSDGKGFGVFGWLGVTSLVLILDLATAVVFGLEYDTMLNAMVDLAGVNPEAPSLFMVPMLLTTLAMRGYILWLLNDGLVVFIVFTLIRQGKEAKDRSGNLSRQASFVNPTMNAMYPDEDTDSYHRPMQTRSAWEQPMSPNEHPAYPYSAQPSRPPSGYHTPLQRQPSGYYEQAQRPPGTYNQNYEQQQRPPGAYTYGSPHDQPPQRPLVLEDPPKGRSKPSSQYVPPPKHIPSPDYSPPLTQKEMLPIRPVLRKPPGKIGQIGRTVF